MANITFRNVKDERIKAIFTRAVQKYPRLKNKNIVLVKRKLKHTTMRAQPVMMSFLGARKNRRYKIEFSSNAKLEHKMKIRKLDDDVLFGWFAHELGHIMDYLHYSFFGMLKYGILYLISSHYRMGAERKADLYAIEHGLSDAILATKYFILEHSSLSGRYKARIKKYYMSPDEVLMMMEEEEELKMDDVNIFDPT